MTIKEVSSVIDDINEWNGPNGTVFYVTAMFTDESVGSVGRKDHDAALEVQGLLREAIGIEQDFTLESKGQTKTGRDKFNIKGFGTPGGAATYTAPGGGSLRREFADAARTMQDKARQLASEVPSLARHFASEQEGIRRAVALKAAAQCVVGTSPQDVLKFADLFLEWLSSEPALSAYTRVEVSPSLPQAGAGSDDLSAGELGPSPSTPAESAGVVGSGDGEAPESTPHIHDYQIRQGVKQFLVCVCGKTTKKVTATT